MREQSDVSLGLVGALEAMGYHARACDVRWLDQPSGVLLNAIVPARALVVARRGAAASDVYLAAMRLSPSGRVHGVAALHNLSRTALADEHSLVRLGERAVYLTADARGTTTVQERKLARAPEQTLASWLGAPPLVVCERSWRLETPAKEAALALDGHSLVIAADGRSSRLELGGDGAAVGDLPLDEQQTGLPEASPTEPCTRSVVAADAPTTAAGLASVLAHATAMARRFAMDRRSARPSVAGIQALLARGTAVGARSDSRFPPAPVVPLHTPSLPGEGVWHCVPDGALAEATEGAPSPLAASFLSATADGDRSLVYVVAWDPRRLELHVAAGSDEPMTETGERGTGTIPRRARVSGRLIAAFGGAASTNAGGLVSEGRLIVAPRPRAATVVESRDGWTEFGAWPLSEHVSDSVVGLRQSDPSFARSASPRLAPHGALCMTSEGHVAYAIGTEVSSRAFSLVLGRLGCTETLELDASRAAFELYGREQLSTLVLVGAEPGRFLRTEPRDFLYLTRRRLLAARDEPAAQGGLPAAVAVARTGHMTVVSIDPRWLARGPRRAGPDTVLSVQPPAEGSAGGVGVYFESGRFLARASSPSGSAELVLRGELVHGEPPEFSTAAACVGSDGVLHYGAPTEPSSGLSLPSFIEHTRCDNIVLMDRPWAIALRGGKDPLDRPVRLGRNRVVFVRGEHAGARTISAKSSTVSR